MPRYPQSNLAACMLPWTDDDQLDVPVFESHIQETLDAGYTCLYLMGTAGEGYALDNGRFRQVIEIFADLAVGDGRDPQVGVIGTSMEQTLERIGWAHALGIRMFQISLPSWGTLDESETMVFFQTVCGRFPDCRFLHYNLPRAGRILYGPEYHRIAEAVPNLVATKNSSTDYARTKDLLVHSGELQHFLLEGNFAMGCTIAECALLCSYDALFPETTWKFFEAGRQGDLEELFRITRLFSDVGNALFAHCPRTMIDGAYDKTYLWLRNPRFSNRLLPPYQGLTAEESDHCRAVFEQRFAEIP